jgi:cysteine desulfurase
MGVAGELIDTALRFGFSRFSTTDDADRAVELISRQYRRLREKSVVENSRV